MTTFFICTAVVFAAIIMCTNAQLAGGLSGVKPADAEVNQLVQRQRANIIKKICDLGTSCPPAGTNIVAYLYKTQVVSGINYFISVKVNCTYYHVRIYTQSWTKSETVVAVQGPKNRTDEILSFDAV